MHVLALQNVNLGIWLEAFKTKRLVKRRRHDQNPIDPGQFQQKQGIINQLKLSRWKSCTLRVYLEWTSTVTRCEIGRVQCKHMINHWFQNENSEFKSTSIRKPKPVCVFYGTMWLTFKPNALSLSLKTCSRTRRVQQQRFVTKIRRWDTQMKTPLISCQKITGDLFRNL